MIMSIDADAGKAFDKIQHSFTIKKKNSQKGDRTNVPQKAIYDKPTANTILVKT